MSLNHQNFRIICYAYFASVIISEQYTNCCCRVPKTEVLKLPSDCTQGGGSQNSEAEDVR